MNVNPRLERSELIGPPTAPCKAAERISFAEFTTRIGELIPGHRVFGNHSLWWVMLSGLFSVCEILTNFICAMNLEGIYYL
jgi:hypothetical protein